MTGLIDRLCDVYEKFNAAHNLDLGSADEHLFDETLTGEQRKWLRRFTNTWERAEMRDTARYKKALQWGA